MTKAQEAKKFAKAHGLKVNTSGRVPMLSRDLGGGRFWTECFEDWNEAHAFLMAAKTARESEGKAWPWA